MLVAAAVCPHPPVLVPELAAGAAGELAEIRRGCETAVAGVLGAEPDLVVVVGGADVAASHGPGSRGDFSGFGVGLAVGGDGPGRLPLSLAVGRWLLGRAGWGGPLALRAVGCDTAPQECARVGRELADSAPRVGMLVMGDGSARRTPQAPGYVDDRAVGYDDEVARALAAADVDALLALDPALSAELLVAGRASWQVLAGAAAGATGGGTGWDGWLLGYDAPYGVGYLVAQWLPTGNARRQD